MPPLSEQFIQDSFHSYLKSSLTQAKAERLVDAELLSSAEGDLMITGPALCLYFAALRCITNPPSVPLPRQEKSSTPMELSTDNCPPAFQGFLKVWANTVEPIQSLAPEYQHDLARVICNLPPLQDPPEPSVLGIAQDLRAVAIEISQRRSFQDRYASDLQAALDAGNTGKEPKSAGFVPPPAYEPSPPVSPAHSNQSSPQYATHDLPPQSPTHLSPFAPVAPLQTHRRTSSHPAALQPSSGSAHSRGSSVSSTSHSRPPSRGQGSSRPYSPSPSRSSPSPSPTLLSPSTTRAIDLIRETLYASLADVIESQAQIREQLKRDRTRAYFSAVAFAIIEVATHCITPNGSVIGVLGAELTLEMCPEALRPLMRELAMIGQMAKNMELEDDKAAVAYARSQAERSRRSPEERSRPRVDEQLPPIPLMDRVKRMLVEGVGCDIPGTGTSGRLLQREGSERQQRRSIEGRAVAFTNRVNALSLNMTKLPAFRERQDLVFQILAGIGNE
ncbi:hypothetical protein DL96DRAFT_1608658 [Flagelloscypha sp. PMI_526]|nr:hypothetical protein DL96DRAFT_1608658 [Flagelloscypha sp. PMI_526]